ncbi:hypothetical protein GCM10007989_33540 [Devosia pacifica]|uniref:Endonuclease/exonuclease/phosphatase domain-containing protein n=2 Tax=Devosia pacifica TaxID=1335967 RepID=A0A918SEH8_9HYPH|nr:hypothetical protein GCM10007989_33540 [Devosia pacifica]
MLALCEVANDDIDALKGALAGSPYSVAPYFGSDNTGRFGICLIWKPDTITIISHDYIVDIVRGYSKRIAVRLTVSHNSGFVFDMFLVHWPSRLHMNEESASRELLGSALRRSVTHQHLQGQQHIVVMGDFNDEPFNDALTEGLRSTRDPNRASQQSDLFYNPFWRHMAPATGHVWGQDASERQGSYYYRSHQLDRWRVIDQILFSSSFVMSDGVWQMVENGTHISQDNELREIVESSRSKIDHLPIFGEIRRKK